MAWKAEGFSWGIIETENFGASYAKIIISAILAFAESEKIQKSLLDRIRKIVRNKVCGALQNRSFVQTGSYAEIEKTENCEKSQTSKNEKSENAPMTIFEKTVISPYDENEENDKHIDMEYLDSLDCRE